MSIRTTAKIHLLTCLYCKDKFRLMLCISSENKMRLRKTSNEFLLINFFSRFLHLKIIILEFISKFFHKDHLFLTN